MNPKIINLKKGFKILFCDSNKKNAACKHQDGQEGRTHSQKVRSGWLRVVMRRRFAAPSPELREEEEGTASLYRVAMPPLRRGDSSSELSSSYRLFFTLLFLDERGESLSAYETEK